MGSYRQIIINNIMEDDNQADPQSSLSIKQSYKPEVISIRKRLAAPNNILPGSMLRSQTSQHMLPLKPDQLSQPGFQMPLEEISSHSEIQQATKPKDNQLRPVMIKQSKNGCKSELSYAHKSQNVYMTHQPKESVINSNILHFLNGNLKGLLRYSNNIVFMSPTVFLGQLDNLLYFQKRHPTKQQEQKQKKLFFIRILSNNKNFPAIPYDLKPHKNIQKLEELDLINQSSAQLIFNDEFQSSNLLLAFKYTQQLNKNVYSFNQLPTNHHQTYLLTTRLDYNTRSYGQWFYFRVVRRERIGNNDGLKGNVYRFMIISMTKNGSMFGKGLKVSVCRNGVWRKQGSNIKYYKNTLRRQESSQFFNEEFVQDQYLNSYISFQSFYTLQFNLQIHPGQEIYIAYNEPYTYSRLGKLLDKMVDKYEHNPSNVINLRRHRLVEKTYLANNIDVITFSAKGNHSEAIPVQQKKVIVIMGRTHPIQTAGSHVIEGILNQVYKSFIQNPLQSSTEDIFYKLLQHYIIKIIPMVNPDGVIIGNSRCNILGYDLNRCWRLTKEDKCRQIYFIKHHILEYQERIEMFIDLHAHSKKKNVFAYGCHDNSNPFATREFPYLLSKLSERDFLYQECRFTKASQVKANKNKKVSKDGTARIYLYDILKIPNVFTIQNSYCSAKDSMFHYDEHSYQIIGADILRAIALYFLPSYKTEGLQSLTEMLSQKNKIKFDLRTSNSNHLQLELSINEQIQIKNSFDQAKQYRQNLINELHSNQQNISIGLIKHCSISDSEQQKRLNQIPQIKKKLKNASESEIKKKKKKSNISAINEEINKQLYMINGNKYKYKKQALNISSTHSENALAKVYKITRQKFKTLGKQTEDISVPIQNLSYISNKGSSNLFMPISTIKAKHKVQQSKNKNPTLAVVDIGSTNDIQRINEKKSTIYKNEKTMTTSQFINIKLKKINGEYLNQKKQQEIKQYFQNILRNKQRFYPNKHRNQNIQLKISNNIFQKHYQQFRKPSQNQITFKGMNFGDKQVRSVKYQQRNLSHTSNHNVKQKNPQVSNKISPIKVENSKSSIRNHDYYLKSQHSSRVSKDPNLLINDMRLSRLANFKNNIYKKRFYTEKETT